MLSLGAAKKSAMKNHLRFFASLPSQPSAIPRCRLHHSSPAHETTQRDERNNGTSGRHYSALRTAVSETSDEAPLDLKTANEPWRDDHRHAWIVFPPISFPASGDVSTDTHPPPKPQDAIFPEALKTLKQADPDVYNLVQKEKLRQMYVKDNTLGTRRSIAFPNTAFPTLTTEHETLLCDKRRFSSITIADVPRSSFLSIPHHQQPGHRAHRE